MSKEYEIIWLEEERTFAQLVMLGAHYSLVKYNRGGIDYEVLVSNDEFNHIEGETDGSED